MSEKPSNRTRRAITPEMLDAVSKEMQAISFEIQKAAEQLRESGKPYVVEFGYTEVTKHLQRGRNLAKNVIGSANVGGDVEAILAEVEKKQAMTPVEKPGTKKAKRSK